MHPKLLSFRYKLFRYRLLERALASQPHIHRLLDIGCGDGENLLRFDDLHLQRVGLEVSMPRLRTARQHGLSVFAGTGTQLPLLDQSFDLIYIAHVLHHVEAYEAVLREAKRCLAPNGRLFLIETVTDHPLLRLGRAIRPSWQGDEVEVNWDYATLTKILTEMGFNSEQSGRYNLIFFLWEMFPLAFWPFEIFTPLFVYLDLWLAKWWSRYSVHCYFVLKAAD